MLKHLKEKVHRKDKDSEEDDGNERVADYDYDSDNPIDKGAKNVIKERDLLEKLHENRRTLNKLDALQQETSNRSLEESRMRGILKDKVKRKVQKSNPEAVDTVFRATMKQILVTGIAQPVKLHNGIIEFVKKPNKTVFDDIHDKIGEKLEKLSGVGPIGTKVFNEDGIAYSGEVIRGKYFTDYHERQEDEALGVCFSGGGSRAMVSAQGQMLALYNAGLINKVKYFSAVSGGSWAVACFSFRNAADSESSDDDEYILGKKANDDEFVIPEGEFEKYDLKYFRRCMNQRALSKGTTKSVLVKYIEQLATGTTRKSPKWFNVIKKIHLDRYNLGQDGPICYDDEHVSDVIHRTGDCIPKNQCCVVRKNRPFPIFNSCVIWPLGEHREMSLFECTPLYTGVMPHRDVNDISDRFYGGGFVESAVFGSRLPISFTEDSFECEPFARIYSLSEAIGTSSMALAQELSKLAELELAIEYFVPTRDYWPLHEKHRTEFYEDQPFGDGGIVDNTGIMALLERKVPNIVVFSNHQGKPEVKNGKGLSLDDSVQRHFEGFHPEMKVEVFSKDVYESMSKTFIDCMEKGEPMVWVGENVPVLENRACGVEKHTLPKLIWFYLHKSENFVNMLHPSMIDAVTGSPSKVDQGVAWLPAPFQNHLPLVNHVVSNHFSDFPHYNTVSKLTLTNAEANLLSTYTNWATKESVVPVLEKIFA